MSATREAWLASAVELLRPRFSEIGANLPEKVRVGVGFTSKGMRAKGANAIGQCWYPEAVGDGAHELIVVPTITEATRALDVLAHELIHVAAGPEAKHGPEFKRLAVAIGLEGKMTATVAGPEFLMIAHGIVVELGEYPNQGITLQAHSAHPKQSTRMLKVECPDCGYTVRTTRKWLELGTPTCVCGSAMAAA